MLMTHVLDPDYLAAAAAVPPECGNLKHSVVHGIFFASLSFFLIYTAFTAALQTAVLLAEGLAFLGFAFLAASLNIDSAALPAVLRCRLRPVSPNIKLIY
jgi:hypothetical protein